MMTVGGSKMPQEVFPVKRSVAAAYSPRHLLTIHVAAVESAPQPRQELPEQNFVQYFAMTRRMLSWLG
jgi:hypothetical protein